MGILKELTKEYFGDTMRGEEYVKFNTDKMTPIDMGGSVLWADRDLAVSEGGGWYKYDKYFTGEEMFKMKFDDGWRVPTFDEFLELFDEKIGVTRHKKGDYDFVDGVILIQSDISGDLVTYNKLEFDIGGRYDKDEPDIKLFSGRVVQRWSHDIDESCNNGTGKLKFVLIFDFAADKKDIEEWKKYPVRRWCMDDNSTSMPIRLVKDKK